MTLLIAIAMVAMVGAAVWLCWRKHGKSESRFVSLVLLLREPMMFDPFVLARSAGRAWNVDLGDGAGEGADGFVVAAGPVNTIVHGDRAYLVNCIPAPYVDDPESAAESIVELRTRKAFAEHRAWISCDALGVADSDSAERIADEYLRLAKLLAEFLDDNCLLVYLPESSRSYAVNDETLRALQADDPLAALSETLSAPVIGVSVDDPLMEEAVAAAQDSWPRFVAAFEATAGTDFSVKAPLSHGDTTEYIWLEVTAIEGGRIYGMLANDPADLGPLKLGSKVSVALCELNDWCYLDSDGQPQGAFTLDAVHQAWRRQQTS